MNREELLSLIATGEGYNLEFKESVSDSLGKEVCAFANANGGKILLGVADDRTVRGLSITNALKSQVQDIARKLDPHLQVVLEEAAGVLVVDVPEGAEKPYSIAGKFYIRQGTNCQQLERNEIREFFQSEGRVVFDETPNPGFSIGKDVSETAFDNFVRRSKISRVIGRPQLLDNLLLMQGGRMKNAGVLMFCKDVARFFRNATIMCVLFQGTDKYKILDSKEFTGDAYSNYEGALAYLESKLNTEYIIKKEREEKLELPEDALREALINAIAHRDYFSNALIQVHIFLDRVEIINPGGLARGMRIEELGRKSVPRNHLLFGLMQRMELVERAGTGINRMNLAMEGYRLAKPKIEATPDWFTITFLRPDLQKESYQKRMGSYGETTQKTVEKTVENAVEKTVEKILALIEANPRITQKELIEKTGLTRRGVEWNLSKLKEEGKLRRVGPDKGGHWEVINRS